MKKAFIIVAVVIIASIVVTAIPYGMYLAENQKDYEEAHLYFAEMCEYVTEYQESYDIVSKYELAKLNVENDYITVQPTGEHQDERDKVFKFVYDATAKKLPNENYGVIYVGMLNSNYEVLIVYQHGIVNRNKIYNTDETYIVNDDLYVCMIRIH